MFLSLALAATAALSPTDRVDYNRDVRPILSDLCFHCHGPDEEQRKASLRLDTQAGAAKDGVVVAGKPDESDLIARITAADPDDRMPPADSGRRLSPAQIETLRRWIAQGATFDPHWAFVPPVRPPLPEGEGAPGAPIDRFVRARLQHEGLTPSPAARPESLLRRVTLDLTGVPPTPAELRAFVADRDYGKAVDRLLASPRYGERMAIRWLEAARYADTNGYQGDGERVMWRWRDWVIDAFNGNMPFDRFTIEQLAGDLLPGATLDQRIATAFNRNHRGNSEGGIVPEEYLAEYAVDRVETTSVVWMGLTMGCARCHDHKFDPLSQRDFYGMFALFGNLPEHGKARKIGNSAPFLLSPTPAQVGKLAQLDAALGNAEEEVARLAPVLEAAERAWTGDVPAHWNVERGLALRVPSETFDGTRFVESDIGTFEEKSRFTAAMRVTSQTATGGLVSRMDDDGDHEGWSVRLAGGHVEVGLSKRWLDDSIRVHTRQRVLLGRPTHVAVTYDGSQSAAGVRVYLDGVPAELVVEYDGLNNDVTSGERLRIGARGTGDRFKGRIEDVRLHGVVLDPDEVVAVAGKPRRAYFLAQVAAEELRAAPARLHSARAERQAFVATVPTTMVMQELAERRPTYLLIRGEYDKHGPRVDPAVPGVFGAPPVRSRLEFARWLVSPQNPLTARVLSNRLWQMLFGQGLVRTVDDFGSQGEWPTHPELLDWLASELVASGWDVKALLRTIVTSATYRQSSNAPAALLERDPENRLLARGPRFRLPAEMVRDQALAASGLLVERLGGPSVRPYLPDGLGKDMGQGGRGADKGDGLYRRSLYTFWKRTVAPPNMTVFDAPTRETCSVRTNRTNTPLQALTLLNDPTFVEAARLLGERMMNEGGVGHGFRLVLGREPRAAELAVLRSQQRAHLGHYRRHPADARALLSVGDKPSRPSADLAAYTQVALLILNLDETVTKE